MFALLAVDCAEFVTVVAAFAGRPVVDGEESEEAGQAGEEMEDGPGDLRGKGEAVATGAPRAERDENEEGNRETNGRQLPGDEFIRSEKEREYHDGRHHDADEFVPKRVALVR